MDTLVRHLQDACADFDPASHPSTPHDKHGWMDPYVMRVFNKLHASAPLLIVEVGSWKGQSAIAFAKRLQTLGPDHRLLCVDVRRSQPIERQRALPPCPLPGALLAPGATPGPRPVPVFSCPRRARSAALPRQPQPRRGSAAAGGERGRADSGSPSPVPPCTPSPRLLLPALPPTSFVPCTFFLCFFFIFYRRQKWSLTGLSRAARAAHTGRIALGSWSPFWCSLMKGHQCTPSAHQCTPSAHLSTGPGHAAPRS